jgi:hypothetical protein
MERLNGLKADLYQAMGKAVGYSYSIDYLEAGLAEGVLEPVGRLLAEVEHLLEVEELEPLLVKGLARPVQPLNVVRLRDLA